MKARWLVAPLAALFLLFSTGAAAAPECHVEVTTQPASKAEVLNSHAGHSHSHSSQVTRSAVSSPQESLIAAGSILNNEICAVVGFIVLLLLRFARTARSALTVKRFSLPTLHLPQITSKNLGYLNLNHLQLGIIRI